jgi:SpoVK/Ycf46/Vps4 family AAA+-type ATPase
MQEREAPVFVVATCNDIAQLPPEMLRKGRFDEIFFVDLPEAAARVEIYRLQIASRKRDPEAFDLEMLATASGGFSGAEIEQVVVSALYAAYAEDRELTTADLRAEIEKTNPLSMTMSEKIDDLRAWASGRAVAAGRPSSGG